MFSFRNNTINRADKKKYKKIGKKIDKANNVVDYDRNISKKDNDEESINDKVVKNTINKLSNVGSVNFNGINSLMEYRQRLQYYRKVAMYPEINEALDMISNEVTNLSFNGNICKLNLTNLGEKNISNEAKNGIYDLFEELTVNDYEIRRRLKPDVKKFLTEGELYYQKILTDDGKYIKRIRKIPPDNIYPIFFNGEPQLFIEIVNTENLEEEDIEEVQANIEDFIDRKIDDLLYGKTNNSEDIEEFIKVYPKEEITYITWNNEIESKEDVTSYLENIRQSFNRLATMESYLMIYRMTRSVLSYMIEIDAGNLPQRKKEALLDQYIRDYENDELFNAEDGIVDETKAIQTAIKHFWFVKGGDIEGSNVQTLDTKPDFSNLDDIKYFERKFLRSIRIPIHRWQDRQEGSNLGNSGMSGDMINEELEFKNFVDSNVRMKFGDVFIDFFQFKLGLEGFKESVINKINYEIKWYDKNFWSIYVNKAIYSSYSEMANSMGDYANPEWILKNIYDFDDSKFQELIKYKLRGKEYLNKLFDPNEEIDEEIKEKIKNDYLYDDDEYNNRLQKDDKTNDNVSDVYKKNERFFELTDAVEYIISTVKELQNKGKDKLEIDNEVIDYIDKRYGKKDEKEQKDLKKKKKELKNKKNQIDNIKNSRK